MERSIAVSVSVPLACGLLFLLILTAACYSKFKAIHNACNEYKSALDKASGITSGSKRDVE